MTNLYIPVCALLIALLTNIVFFSKKRIKSNETDLYKIMLLFSLVDSIILSLIIFLGYINFYTITLIKIFNIIDFIMYLLWISSFYLYIVYLDKKNNFKKIQRITKYINIISFILIITTPVNPYNNNGIMYVDGLSTNILYITIAIYLILIILSIVKNIKNIFNKKYIPLYALIIIILFALIIRKLNPTLIITSAVLSFMNLIMYHTIENPDMKMLKELENNRDLIEKNNEDKSNLLFKLYQEVRVPIKNIEEISFNMLNKKRVNELVSDAKDINIESKNLSLLVNNVLDISNMNINKIKIYKNKFDIYKLFDEIVMITNNNIDKNIEFKFNIANNLPVMYGDSIKLKQIICSILNYSIINTKNGYIELNIDAITKYDITRLIITVIDTGKTIELNEINNIMSYSDENLIDYSSLNMDLRKVNNLVKILNGTFFIKSRKKDKNSYRIIIDHEIETNTSNIDVLNAKRNILLINDNYDELKEYSKFLKKYNLKVTTSMYGNDSIDRIRNGEKYDLIVIDDEMQPYNAIKTIEELKKISNFKTKVIIMIGINKEFIKEHYIKDGFSAYILRDNMSEDLKQIIDKL